MKKTLVFCFFIILAYPCIFAQEIELSRGFDIITLGLPYDDAQNALIQSPYVFYRGEPDVSFRPGTRDPILRAAGLGFVEEIYLQFRENVVYSIILVMNEQRIDYFTFYQKFSVDYGNPKSLTPQRSIWEDGETRIILEKPVVVQYIDLEQFTAILEEQSIQQSAQEFSKDLFLDSF